MAFSEEHVSGLNDEEDARFGRDEKACFIRAHYDKRLLLSPPRSSLRCERARFD